MDAYRYDSYRYTRPQVGAQTAPETRSIQFIDPFLAFVAESVIAESVGLQSSDRTALEQAEIRGSLLGQASE